MKLKPEVKQFIRDNIRLIDKNDWKSFWLTADEDLDHVIFEYMHDVCDMTEFLYSCGCNPLSGIDFIPEGFLCGSDRSSFDIPNGITHIHYGAFSSMDRLTSVVLPETVMYVSSNAFEGCTNLTTVTILNPQTQFSKSSFERCDNLSTVVYNGTRDDFSTYQDQYSFKVPYGCKIKFIDGEITW